MKLQSDIDLRDQSMNFRVRPRPQPRVPKQNFWNISCSHAKTVERRATNFTR